MENEQASSNAAVAFDDQEAPTSPNLTPIEGGKVQKPRGFATLPRDRVREIARLGGKRAHELKVAHEFTSEEASIAGKKGGRTTANRRIAKKAGLA